MRYEQDVIFNWLFAFYLTMKAFGNSLLRGMCVTDQEYFKRGRILR